MTDQSMTAEEAERRNVVTLCIIHAGVEVLAGAPDIDAGELVVAVYRTMRIKAIAE
jgi:hypothetical protein